MRFVRLKPVWIRVGWLWTNQPFYVSRILEQCIYTNYKPYFNIKDEQKLKDIIFFNFSFEASDLSLSLDQTHVYRARSIEQRNYYLISRI